MLSFLKRNAWFMDKGAGQPWAQRHEQAQSARLAQALVALREELWHLTVRAGKLEEQRNRERQKYGIARRVARERIKDAQLSAQHSIDHANQSRNDAIKREHIVGQQRDAARRELEIVRAQLKALQDAVAIGIERAAPPSLVIKMAPGENVALAKQVTDEINTLKAR